MAQMLLATQRLAAALKVHVKIILSLSVSVARTRFVNPGAGYDFLTELDSQVGLALSTGQRQAKWIRRHLPPFAGNSLISSVSPAVWMVEDLPENSKGNIDGSQDIQKKIEASKDEEKSTPDAPTVHFSTPNHNL